MNALASCVSSTPAIDSGNIIVSCSQKISDITIVEGHPLWLPGRLNAPLCGFSIDHRIAIHAAHINHAILSITNRKRLTNKILHD
jgi:hypothetical protein